MKVGIVYGGDSCESQVSIVTALSIYALTKDMFGAKLIFMCDNSFYMGSELEKLSFYNDTNSKKLQEVFFTKKGIITRKGLKNKYVPVEVLLNCCHGGNGENGALSGLASIFSIPITSSCLLSSAITMDKTLTKIMLSYYGFNTLDYEIVYDENNIQNLERLGLPLILKPANLGSSVGISFVKDFSKLKEEVKKCLTYDNKILVEKGLDNFLEYNCAVCKMDNTLCASLIESPIVNKDFLNYDDKYLESTDRQLPAKISKELEREIIDISKKVYKLLECSGVVRIDFLYNDDTLYVNEVNTIPGSLSNYLYKGKGIDTLALVENLIIDAIEKEKTKAKLINKFDSSLLSKVDFKKIIELESFSK